MLDSPETEARNWFRIDSDTLFLTGLGVAVGGLILFGAQSISPAFFDPLGSQPVPVSFALILLVLSILILIRRFRNGVAEAKRWDRSQSAGRGRIVFMFAIMVAYLGAMQFGAGFVFPTTGFLAVGIVALARTPKAIIPAVLIAAVLSFGAEWLLTSFFFVDLPR